MSIDIGKKTLSWGRFLHFEGLTRARQASMAFLCCSSNSSQQHRPDAKTIRRNQGEIRKDLAG